jgi:hypothetical protein
MGAFDMTQQVEIARRQARMLEGAHGDAGVRCPPGDLRVRRIEAELVIVSPHPT